MLLHLNLCPASNYKKNGEITIILYGEDTYEFPTFLGFRGEITIILYGEDTNTSTIYSQNTGEITIIPYGEDTT